MSTSGFLHALKNARVRGIGFSALAHGNALTNSFELMTPLPMLSPVKQTDGAIAFSAVRVIAPARINGVSIFSI